MSRITAVVRSLSVVSILVCTAFPSIPKGAADAPPVAADPRSRSAKSVPASFQELAAGVGLGYTQPAGFQDIPVVVNSLWPYEHAVTEPNADIEIRYAVRPIERMEIAYDDPHSNAPDPNHIFPMMFQTLIGLLSDGRHAPSREYPPDQARSKFNADWAAAALFDVDRRFTERHEIALMIAIHKDNLADAYTIYLFDDYERARPVINATLGSLKFLP